MSTLRVSWVRDSADTRPSESLHVCHPGGECIVHRGAGSDENIGSESQPRIVLAHGLGCHLSGEHHHRNAIVLPHRATNLSIGFDAFRL